MNLKKITPEEIKAPLKKNQVFVFGSNTGGYHGAGAARFALEHFGAVMEQGVGLMGQSYAVPTKDDRLKVLPLTAIGTFVKEFLEFALAHPEKQFLVTKIGCGLSRYSPKKIGRLFAQCNIPDNVWLPAEFWAQVLTKSNV